MFSHLFQKFIDIPRRFHRDSSKYNLDGRYFISDVAKYILWYKEQTRHSEPYIASPEVRYICGIIDLFFANKKAYEKCVAWKNRD